MRNPNRLWRRYQAILLGPGRWRVIITTKGGLKFVGEGATIDEADRSAVLENYKWRLRP